MISGILVLGSIMMVMFHRRERVLKATSARIAADLEEARALRQQLDDSHLRASTIMAAAQRLSARLDERLAALDGVSQRLNATRQRLPRPPVQRPVNAPRIERHAPAEPSVATVEAKPAPDPLARKVYDLADAGRSTLAIARDLNEHPGKIELILALRQA